MSAKWDVVRSRANSPAKQGMAEAYEISELCSAVMDLKDTVGPVPQEILNRYDNFRQAINATVEGLEQDVELLRERIETLTEQLQERITVLAERVTALEEGLLD